MKLQAIDYADGSFVIQAISFFTGPFGWHAYRGPGDPIRDPATVLPSGKGCKIIYHTSDEARAALVAAGYARTDTPTETR